MTNIKLVPPEGPKNCDIALIGEAPAKDEIRLGRPFVGMTGKLNDELMASAGIHRNKIFITNVWKTQVGKKPRNFPYNLVGTDAYKEFLELLKTELEETTAKVFIACGELSLFALTGQKGIVQRRGSVYPCTLIEGRKVLAVRHPASALPFRNYCLQYVMVHDYKRAVEESKFPEIRYPERELVINPSFDFVNDDWLRAILVDGVGKYSVAFDIEVINEEVSHISLCLSPDYAVSISFTGDRYTVEQEAEIWRRIAQILENPNIKKIGQNLTFDATFLFRKYGIRTTNIEDTMVGMGILYAGFPTAMKYKGLDFITSIYTNEPYYKDEGKKYFKLSTDDDTFSEYNAKDSAICIEALPKIKRDLGQFGNLETFETTCKLIEPLTFMAEHGIRVDVDGLKKASKDAEEEIKSLRSKLNELVGYEINPSSPKQLKNYFYVEKGIKPYVSRSGSNRGSITTNVDALKRMSRKGIEEAKLLLDIRHLSKRKGTYYDTKISDDGRLRCSYNPVGTRQGRLSSGKNIFGEGTNNQNLPMEMKRLLLADEGYVMYNMDLEQAENRIVAYIAPEPLMIDAFESGIDIHKRTAGLVFGKDETEVTDKEGTCPLCYDPSSCGHKGERFWGKKCVIGSTEVLTPRGWIPISDWNYKETMIAQWDKHTRNISFVFATNCSNYTSEVIELKGRNSHVIGTPNHRIPLVRTERGKFTERKLSDVTRTHHYGIPTCGYFDNIDSYLSIPEVQLLVAFQADGRFNNKSHQFCFTKDRKISRIKYILNTLEIPYSESIQSDGRTLIGFIGPSWLTKSFSYDLLHLGVSEMKVFVEELSFWDGYRGDNRKQYFSTNKNNVEWAQTLAHLCGYTALIEEREPTGFGKKKLYVLKYNSRNQYANLSTHEKKLLKESQKVFGPEVPSGFFLIRSNGVISVTGNSNHGFNYFLGYKQFAFLYEIGEVEAKRIRNGYLRAYPGLEAYWNWVKQQVRKTRTLTNPFGRTFWFTDQFTDKMFKQAFSFIPQSTVPDKINRHGILFCWDNFSEVELLAQVHDSIVFQIPIEIGWQKHADILNQIKASLEQPIRWKSSRFTIPTGCEMGLNMGDMVSVGLEASELEQTYKELVK